RLDFTVMIRARYDERPAASDSNERFAGGVLDRRPHVGSADVVIRGNVNHPRFRAEGDRRPVLPAVRSGTEVGAPVGDGYVLRVTVGPPGFGIETSKDILINERLAFDELDRACASLEEPQVPVARDIDQTFVHAAVPLVVHEDGR